MRERVIQSTKKLIGFIEKSDFKGYDPYDLLNSSLPLRKSPHKIQFLLTQLSKRSPINLRPLIGIKKNYNSKGMALLLNAYSRLYRITGEDEYKKSADFTFNWLSSNFVNYNSCITWGFDYPYANRNGFVEKGFPTIIHHSYVLKGLAKYYEVFNSKAAYDLIRKSDRFIINELPLKNYDKGSCFGYYPSSKGCCYNASLHAAESLALIDSVNGKEKYVALIIDLIEYVISRQKSNGSWLYSHSEENIYNEYKQIDFHQGFIIESLKNIKRYLNLNDNVIINNSINHGLNYYYKYLFDFQGRSIYRFPRKYPIDIHHQAQGIITFSLFANESHIFKERANQILQWTIINMQSKKGSFYYQLYPNFIVRIPHIRWGQAWMLLAMSIFMENIKKKGI